jgi:aminoglycoside 2'-N-acetyltransferase I
MMRDMPLPSPVRLRRLRSSELTGAELTTLRRLMDDAFDDDPEERFSDDDWEHALGGMHVVAELGGRIVGHASVVPRTLFVDGRPVQAGYVEAVATAAAHQGEGIGTLLMRAAGDHIRDAYQLGALGTGAHRFYERLGWWTWRGPSSVRMAHDERRTPDEDGFIMVLETPTSPALDLDAPIACEWRNGDVW